MPAPKKGEKRKDYVGRCISRLRHEGDNRDNRILAGQCYGMYDNAKKKGGEEIMAEEYNPMQSNVSAVERAKKKTAEKVP